MNHEIITIILSILILSCSNESARKNQLSHIPDIKMIDERIDSLVGSFVKLDIFSGVVLLAEAGEPIYHKSYGLADRDNRIPVTLDTKFNIGSMNKSFTKVVIMKLIEQGKLNPGQKLTEIIPGFTQKDADKISISHLLEHKSGFGDYHSPEFFQKPAQEISIAGITESLKKSELLFTPGEEEEYSNSGYILLGSVIEKISGKSYAANVNEYILGPLQLNNTILENVEAARDRARGYMRTISGIEDQSKMFSNPPMSDGGAWSTTIDMLKFYRSFFYDHDFISEEIRNQSGFFRRINENSGKKGAGIPISGGLPGFNTVHMEMINDNISILVFSNMDEPVAEKICFGIHALLNGRSPEPASLPASINVYESYKKNGPEFVRNNFDSLSVNFPPQDPKDFILNMIGYDLLFSGKHAEALEIFRLNIDLFPDVANCYDSYGEALLISGKKDEARKAYRKALELKPDLKSSQDALKKIEG